MLNMAQIEYIKHLYESEGKSLREIARMMGKDFRTVQKYAHMNDWSPKVLPNMEPENYPVLGPYISTIDEWLDQDVREPRKQRHTTTKLFKRLQKEKEFTGSYASVRRYAVRKKFLIRQSQEGYLPLTQPEGHAQVDFGDFKYYDGLGLAHEGHALIVAFPHSNAGWMQVFPSENQECLLEGLKRIFYYIGGVPIRIKADNMTTAVAKVCKGTERVISDGFYRFMLHHRFEADFCNPASGNEKGNVESKVGYDRRNMLVPVPVIDDFSAFNEELFRMCDEDHEREHYRHGTLISKLWKQEKECLLTLPQYEYDVFRYEALTVGKTGFVTVDKSKYGLTPELSGKIIHTKIYFDRIEIYFDHQLLKIYNRSYNHGEEVFDWKQYLPVLVRKPGATEHTRFFEQMPKLWQQHLLNTKGKERKTALMLLMEIVQDGNEMLCDKALELAEECGRLDADIIRQCYYMIAKPENHPNPLVLSSSPPLLNYSPDLSVYDGLMGGAVG